MSVLGEGWAVQLGQTRDPAVLVPGDPDAVAGVVVSCGRLGAALGVAGKELGAIDAGGWQGAAADGFRARFDSEPDRWLRAGDAFADAAGALETYAGVLRWAQDRAAEAVSLYEEGEVETAAARAEYRAAVHRAEQLVAPSAGAGGLAPVVMPFEDPGEAKREAARDLLRRAREQLASAGNEAERIVAAARDVAPQRPAWWQELGEAAVEYGKGAWEATLGMGQFAWSVSSLRLTVDPRGYHQTMASLAGGVQHAAAHPTEFGKAALDWNTWKDNPARALGRLVPDLLLGAATAGSGTAIVRGARGAKTLDELTDLAKTPTPSRYVTPDELPPGQAANYTRYEKKLPSKHEPVQVEQLPDGSIRMTAKVPANNIPGSYAEYVKTVDPDGNTIEYVKHTYGPHGELIHSKVK